MFSSFCNKEEISKNLHISPEDIEFQYLTSIFDITQEEWNYAAPSDNLFLQYAYLAQLERFPPKNVSFAYLIFQQNGQAIGVAYFQISSFDAASSLDASIQNGLIPSWAATLAKPLHFKTLVAGNLLLTGEHGFYFQSSITENIAATTRLRAIDYITARLKQEDRKVLLFFVKDFEAHQDQLTKVGFGEFDFYPNMQLAIRENWVQFNDYLDDMTTKYRTRAKRAFKKIEGLVKYELDEMLLERHQDEMFTLYLTIANGVGFNLVEIHRNYFLSMKRTFGDVYEVWGIFDQNRLVGFYTTLHNHEELETGFLGFEEQYNASHQLYLNMLYDMVRQGIERQVKRIVFARTAMEIKSSVGAEPFVQHTYIKHNYRLLNGQLPTIIKLLSPPSEWVQRHPFKE